MPGPSQTSSNSDINKVNNKKAVHRSERLFYIFFPSIIVQDRYRLNLVHNIGMNQDLCCSGKQGRKVGFV